MFGRTDFRDMFGESGASPSLEATLSALEGGTRPFGVLGVVGERREGDGLAGAGEEGMLDVATGFDFTPYLISANIDQFERRSSGWKG